MKKVMFIVIVVLLLIAFGVSAFMVANYLIDGKAQAERNEELAQMVRTFEQSSARHLVFVIGGSFGMAESLKKEAWVRLSRSPMTFPHHLARVMVLEQIYRAFKINEGSSYHK